MADVGPYVTTIPVNVHLPAHDEQDAEEMAGVIGAWIEEKLAEHERERPHEWPWRSGFGRGPGTRSTRFYVDSINVGEPQDTEEDMGA